MVFETAEIELLRLAAWFKGLPFQLSERFRSPIFSPTGIASLQAFHLLYYSKEREQFRLTPTGWDFLWKIGFPYPQDAKYISDPVKLRRREQAAKVMFTFHQAGFHIFCDQLEELEKPGVFLSSEAMQRSLRRQNTKVFAGLRLCGVGRFGDCGCLLHFADEMGMYFVNEMSRFRKATANCSRTISIYAADHYSDIIRWIGQEPPTKEKKHKSDWTSFYTAARMTQLPLHLLECSEVGALQLLLMQIPNYREKIAKLALADAYRPVLPTLPDTDALLLDAQGSPSPLVVAMDMDLKRIGRACQTVLDMGYPRLSIVAFSEQMEALVEWLRGSERITYYRVEKELVAQAMDLRLRSPILEPARDREGAYIDVSKIPQRKKAGRPPSAQLDSSGA